MAPTLFLIILIFAAAQIVFTLMLKRRITVKNLTTEKVSIDKITVNNNIAALTAWLDEHYTPKCTANEDVVAMRDATQLFMEEVRREMANLLETVQSEGKLTRKETQEIKTRLADDERDDQQAKRVARRKRPK